MNRLEQPSQQQMTVSGYRLREQREKFEREEAAELEAKLAPAKIELANALAEHERVAAKFWSQPVAALARALQRNEPMAYEGATFTTTPTPQPEQGQDAFIEAYERIQRSGHVLNSVGRQRLSLMAAHLCLAQNVALTDVDNYIIMFNKLVEWGAFEASGVLELGYDPEKRDAEPVAPERRLTVDDLEGIDTSTKAGEALAHQIVADAVFDGDAKSVFREWITSLKNNFDYEMPPEVQRDYVIPWFLSNQRSWLDRKAFDDCRLNLIRRSILPESCLTDIDRLNWEIEEDFDTQSYEGRRRLAREAAQINRRTR